MKRGFPFTWISGVSPSWEKTHENPRRQTSTTKVLATIDHPEEVMHGEPTGIFRWAIVATNDIGTHDT